jgi:hypothetical protein
MPANKYTRSLYKPGTVEAEKAAIANRDPARKAAAEKLLAREGTTNPSGGRAIKMPSKVAPSKAPVAKSPVTKMPLKQQVTRTTTAYRPTPMGKKK